MAMRVSQQPAAAIPGPMTAKRKEPLTSSSSQQLLKRPAIYKTSDPQASHSSAKSSGGSDHRDPRRQETDEFHHAVLQLSLIAEPRRQATTRSPPTHTSASHPKGDGGGASPEAVSLPVRFASHEEYVAAMGPLVLEEIRAEVLAGTLCVCHCPI